VRQDLLPSECFRHRATKTQKNFVSNPNFLCRATGRQAQLGPELAQLEGALGQPPAGGLVRGRGLRTSGHRLPRLQREPLAMRVTARLGFFSIRIFSAANVSIANIVKVLTNFNLSRCA
jgi:hypothetical protein